MSLKELMVIIVLTAILLALFIYGQASHEKTIIADITTLENVIKIGHEYEVLLVSDGKATVKDTETKNMYLINSETKEIEIEGNSLKVGKTYTRIYFNIGQGVREKIVITNDKFVLAKD